MPTHKLTTRATAAPAPSTDALRSPSCGALYPSATRWIRPSTDEGDRRPDGQYVAVGRETGNGVAALLVTPFARDRQLSANERAATAEVRARIVLPINIPLWIDSGTGGAIMPAQLEKLATLQLRLKKAW